MNKFKIFVDIENEEKYLNSMARRGFILEKYSVLGIYTFAKGKPIDLNYKIDYRIFNNKNKYEEYIALFEDAGWIHIYGTQYSGAQYFLPGSNNIDSPEIFSDVESKAYRYKRLCKSCLTTFLFSLFYLILLLINIEFQSINLGYRTPGLWEFTGYKFWLAFLFETPFVVFRFLPFIIFTTFAIVYGYWAYRAKKLIKLSTVDSTRI